VWKTADGPETEAAEPDTFRRVAIAPGGDRIAVSKTDLQVKTGLDVWIKELARGVMTRLTFDPGPDDNPIWSPDGKQIAFAAGRNGSVAQVFRKDASGSGEEERLTDDPYAKAPLDWSRDGKYILYRHLHPDTGRDLLILPLADPKPIIVANTKYTEGTGAISPDGQWIAYASNESGVFQVYVKAFPGVAGGPAGQWQVSTKGGYDVRWRDDGKELYYESLDGDVMAASIQTSSSGVRVESARELFSAEFQSTSLQEFDVTPDGKRFIMIINPKNETSQDRLTVVTNWKAALRK
jgi:Tol biopolymer transport system component